MKMISTNNSFFIKIYKVKIHQMFEGYDFLQFIRFYLS